MTGKNLSHAQNGTSQPSTNSAGKSVNPAILDVLERLAKVCVNAPEKAGLIVYCEELHDVDPSLLAEGAKRYLNDADELFFPSIGKLRRFAAEAEHGILPDWEQIWDRVVEATKVWDQHDAERAIKARKMLGDQVMPFVKLLGGFIALQHANETTMSVLRGQFRESWKNRKTAIETNRRLPESVRPQQRLPATLDRSQQIENLETGERSPVTKIEDLRIGNQ